MEIYIKTSIWFTLIGIPCTKHEKAQARGPLLVATEIWFEPATNPTLHMREAKRTESQGIGWMACEFLLWGVTSLNLGPVLSCVEFWRATLTRRARKHVNFTLAFIEIRWGTYESDIREYCLDGKDLNPRLMLTLTAE